MSSYLSVSMSLQKMFFWLILSHDTRLYIKSKCVLFCMTDRVFETKKILTFIFIEMALIEAVAETDFIAK